jgi:hypothetical protein
MVCFRGSIATLAALTIVSIAFTAPVTARAQTDDRVHLVLDSDRSDFTYSIRAGSRDAPIVFECRAPCYRLVPRGRYVVSVHAEGDDVPDQETDFVLDGDRHLYTSSGSRVRKNVGLGVAVVGMTAVVAGVILTFAAWPGSCDDLTPKQCQDMTRNQDREQTTAGVLLLGGLASTITGWILFGVSRTTISSGPVRVVSNVTFSAAPLPGGGAALGLVGAF